MQLHTSSVISIPVYSPDESSVVTIIRLSMRGHDGEVMLTWTFFDTMERHEEIHADLATALVRVGVLVSTTQDERVREYRGTPDEFARRARDFIVTTTA